MHTHPPTHHNTGFIYIYIYVYIYTYIRVAEEGRKMRREIGGEMGVGESLRLLRLLLLSHSRHLHLHHTPLVTPPTP